MIYIITGIFPTNDDAISATNQLTADGFTKQFAGFTKNSKFQPESLVEDHFIDENEISVHTPNLNRAHKAKNILIKFGADLRKIRGIYQENIKTDFSVSTNENQIIKRKKLNNHKSKLRQDRIKSCNS
jgi:pyruvate/2-oxoglutarate dehydrogenase complex dihydrolipoamide dehydrogenase (E3) component